MEYRIAAYNVENMRRLFKKDAVLPDGRERVDALGRVMVGLSSHILGIVEASDKVRHHEMFLEESGLGGLGFRLGKSHYKRRKQDLVFYYREPFEVVSMDDNVAFYDQWIEDIDEDGIDEVCKFERRPLEARFRHTPSGRELLIILVSFKSKGVFSVRDLMGHQYLALANRKRQFAQAKKLRKRVDMLLDAEPTQPIVVMGDLNDEPGLDSFERLLGASSLETIMGSVFEPSKVLHNALWHMGRDDALKRELWTTEYPDLIVQNFQLHKGWLDHILVSPCMLAEGASPRLVPDSGRVAEKSEDARLASDHYAVYCDICFD